MIPHKIHYCWFGNHTMPPSAQQCLESWRKWCPDFEICRWDEHNFDMDANDYVKQAYEHKKWAFVSDVARFWILYRHGGIYLDTDVELLRSPLPLIERGAFFGMEKIGKRVDVAPGCGMAAPAKDPLLKEILTYYDAISFLQNGLPNTTQTVCDHVTRILQTRGYQCVDREQQVCGWTIYPSAYLCPKDFVSGEIHTTSSTFAIHHFDGSWFGPQQQYAQRCKSTLRKFLPHRAAGHVAAFLAEWKYCGLKTAAGRVFSYLQHQK